MERIVIKVGTAVLTEDNAISNMRMLNLVVLIAKLRAKYEIVLVSSGAVAAGYSTLKIDKRKHIGKKALAAAGQPILMSGYKKMFEIYDMDIAQILLTEDDFDSRKRTRMFQEIINTHLCNDILPIISENDITSTPEQLFGDNDQLAAHVCVATDAQMLIILSDIDGYYDKNPHKYSGATLYRKITTLSEDILDEKFELGNGADTRGIVNKLKAADILMKRGKKMLLCNGFDLSAAESFLLKGKQTLGTLFSREEEK